MINIRPLTPALAAVAAKELNETPERLVSDLRALKEWIKQSPHLYVRTDDQFLVSFLRGCKYSLEKAKQKFDLYYTIRTFMPEVTMNRDPLDERLQTIIRLGIGLPLPFTEKPDSPRLILIRPGAYDASQFSLPEVFKISNMIQDILMREDDNYMIAGQIGILDCSGVTMAHFMQFNPTFIKKITLMSQEASPTRQKGFHFINTPYGFDSVFNVFKSFINDKNKTKLYVHGSNLSSLYKEIPKKLMPNEYGGTAGSVESIINTWEKRIISYRDYYKEEEKFGVDEKKRLARKNSPDHIFGATGSFRQLEVD
ncbi:CLUMA_CG000454, isoform A [Clunio marinus]|uniref:CLUMA_CG000454, isoform A n=1 Tax=Clunio marinus TaxID=568069 RepID=A0A1J1HK45_9DIPT|nr:CLUMA_CG000454, isoform A [Clunio marinus]